MKARSSKRILPKVAAECEGMDDFSCVKELDLDLRARVMWSEACVTYSVFSVEGEVLVGEI